MDVAEVLCPDHNTKSRKGYWYDEEQDWIVQDADELAAIGGDASLEDYYNLKKR